MNAKDAIKFLLDNPGKKITNSELSSWPDKYFTFGGQFGDQFVDEKGQAYGFRFKDKADPVSGGTTITWSEWSEKKTLTSAQVEQSLSTRLSGKVQTSELSSVISGVKSDLGFN
jgi:hypothetical protein